MRQHLPTLDRPAAKTTAAVLRELVARVEADHPTRQSTSPGEYGAQQALAEELAARNLEVEELPFRFSRSLYAVLALHYAVVVIASLLLFWQPLSSAALHLFAGLSYFLDCHYRGFWLRRCLPFRRSQNIVARWTPAGPIRRRIVFLAHADAAPTGWLFEPGFLRWVLVRWPNSLAVLKKQMLLWMISLAILVALDLVYATTGYFRPRLFIGMTLGSLLPLVLMLQIVWNKRIVPGANDNLTGCAAVVALADRLRGRTPDDVEIVYAITGCEESGRGGAWALCRAMKNHWSPNDTTIIGLDTLSGGDLVYHVEGEIIPRFPPRDMLDCAQEVADADQRFRTFRAFHAPAGATDAAPFLWSGFPAICLVRIDPRADIPQNYHLLSDTHDNVDFHDVSDAVDFAEALALALISLRSSAS